MAMNPAGGRSAFPGMRAPSRRESVVLAAVYLPGGWTARRSRRRLPVRPGRRAPVPGVAGGGALALLTPFQPPGWPLYAVAWRRCSPVRTGPDPPAAAPRRGPRARLHGGLVGPALPLRRRRAERPLAAARRSAFSSRGPVRRAGGRRGRDRRRPAPLAAVVVALTGTAAEATRTARSTARCYCWPCPPPPDPWPSGCGRSARSSASPACCTSGRCALAWCCRPARRGGGAGCRLA